MTLVHPHLQQWREEVSFVDMFGWRIWEKLADINDRPEFIDYDSVPYSARCFVWDSQNHFRRNLWTAALRPDRPPTDRCGDVFGLLPDRLY